MVCHSRRLFQNAKGVGNLPRHGLNPHADGEILVGPLGLRSPVPAGGDLYLAHGVVFNAVFHI